MILSGDGVLILSLLALWYMKNRVVGNAYICVSYHLEDIYIYIYIYSFGIQDARLSGMGLATLGHLAC